MCTFNDVIESDDCWLEANRSQHTFAAMTSIADVISSLTFCRHSIISHDPVATLKGVLGAKMLAVAIRELGSVKQVELYMNHLEHRGTEAVAMYLVAPGSSVLSLSLEYNYIEKNGLV
jgi:hypothetical protein